MTSMSTSAPLTSDGANTVFSRETIAASRLSVWCDRLLEMGWLAAVIVAPLFFNIYSSRVFEPDKLTTVRSIAVAMAAIWLVKWIDERRNPNADRRVTWRTPLVAPTLILVVVYILSSLMSVAPRTSLLGSYQRLQGTYTYFSYILIFFMILSSMRTRAQFDRLLNTVVVTSLPVAIYGAIQRLNIDPLPWGGDVTERVAGNMGNSIFIAAYLVIAFFIASGRIVESMASIFGSHEARVVDIVRTALFIVIAGLNAFVIAVLAGSRGPQIGWIAGIGFMVLLLAQLIRRRKLRFAVTMSMMAAGAVVIGGFVFINVSKSEFAESLKKFPMFGRLSSVLQASDGTNLVRKLIWDGNVNLMLPHEAIEFPPGTGQAGPDPFNAIRPLVGYGPESMYVAYNRYYPPALANVEARNASPDRSHNETWDSIVITGAIGFLAYIFLFGAFFYFGFKWVGLIVKRRDTILFWSLWIIGGIVGGVGAVTILEPGFLGVGIAGGVGIGLALFMLISSVMSALGAAEGALHVRASLRDQILMVAIISAAVAHFAEIHLGIAIASTRTTFWALAGALVVVGLGWLRDSKAAADAPDRLDQPVEVKAAEAAVAPVAAATGSARRRRAQAQAQAAARPASATRAYGGFPLPVWFNEAVSYGLTLGLAMGVLAYCFITNSDRIAVPGRVFWGALTLAKGQATIGVLVLFLALLVIGALLFISDAHRHGHLGISARDNLSALTGATLTTIAVAVLVWVAFGTFIAGRLVDFVAGNRQQGLEEILNIANQLSYFPGYIYLLIGVTMFFFAFVNRNTEPVQRTGLSAGGLTGLLTLLPVALLSIMTSNLQPIRADIVYKQANPWDGQGANILQQGTAIQGFDVAIEHYRIAINLAPNEDFYYLWLGRALLEKGKASPVQGAVKAWGDREKCDWNNNGASRKVLADGAQGWGRDPATNPLPSARLSKEDLITAACGILTEARVLNPLNTDHSANLARMWRQSADVTADVNLKRDRFASSGKEYQVATYLSPNNAQLMNEWGTLLMYSLGDLTGAREKLQKSLAIDQKFDQTYLYFGDLNMQEANRIDEQRRTLRAQIAAAATVTGTGAVVNVDDLKTRAAGLDETYTQRLREAQTLFENGLEIFPTLISQTYRPLAFIAQQTGDAALGIRATTRWLDLTDAKGVKVNAADWEALRNIAIWYRDTGKADLAKEAATRARDAAPQDQRAGIEALLTTLTATP